MCQVGFEPKIPVFEWAKTVHALDDVTTVIGTVALNTEYFLNNIYNSVHTSQETHYVSATKPNQLMLFRETIAVYWEPYETFRYTL
jgi:predicted Zn-dependent protease with MMP-like domain